MPQAQNKHLLSAFGKALLAAREWADNHHPDDHAFKAEEQPEFRTAIAILEQMTSQASTNVSEGLEEWIEDVSWTSYCVATDEDCTNHESDCYDFMAYALCKAMVEHGVEIRKPAGFRDLDFLQTPGTDIALFIAKHRANALENAFPEATKNKPSVPRM